MCKEIKEQLEKECNVFLTREWNSIPQRSKDILHMDAKDVFDSWKIHKELEFWYTKAINLAIQLERKEVINYDEAG